MDIVNISRLDFEYRLDTHSPKISKTLFSNIVKTTVVKDILIIIKTVDKTTSNIFEVLTYKIIVTNISKLEINALFFQDTISGDTQFINNSVRINNKNIRCVNPISGFPLGIISPSNFLEITFDVVVLSKELPFIIKNTSNVIFEHTYNIDKPPVNIIDYSNETTVGVNNTLFKEFNISNQLNLPCDYPPIASIIKYNSFAKAFVSPATACLLAVYGGTNFPP